MKYPENRFKFSSQRRQSRKGLVVAIIVIAAAAAITIPLVFIQRDRGISRIVTKEINPRERIYELWEQQSYLELIEFTEDILTKKPLDPYALVFCGFANFYTGVEKYSLEQKLPYIDSAIQCLRKAGIVRDDLYAGEIQYILGKAYYHKGKYYLDLSVRYLEEAVAADYIAPDSYEYLGLAYSELEKYDTAIDYFTKAAETNSKDLLYITLAQTHFKVGDMTKAEEYLIRTINRTKEQDLEEKSRFLLGRIYFEKKEYIKAEDQYRKILEINDKSADAHYYLGEIYDTMQDTVKARAEWRMALKIDPSHYGARLKIYN